MEIFLITVEDEFYLNGLGLVLCPGISSDNIPLPIRVGQPLYIMRPDGTELTTFIKEFMMLRGGKYAGSVLMLLPKNIKAVDVPIGSLVWIVEPA